jgi:hypothetical protein
MTRVVVCCLDAAATAAAAVSAVSAAAITNRGLQFVKGRCELFFRDSEGLIASQPPKHALLKTSVNRLGWYTSSD